MRCGFRDTLKPTDNDMDVKKDATSEILSDLGLIQTSIDTCDVARTLKTPIWWASTTGTQGSFPDLCKQSDSQLIADDDQYPDCTVPYEKKEHYRAE